MERSHGVLNLSRTQHLSVIVVHAQSPETIAQYVNDGKVTDLYVCMNRPQNGIRIEPNEHNGKTMNELTYLEFFLQYIVSRQNKSLEEGRFW